VKKKIVALIMVIAIVFIGASLPQPAQAEKAYQDTVTIAVVNFEPVIGPGGPDKAATLEKIKALTIKAANQGANIIVFPETALTSYTGFPPEQASALAETIPGPATDAIQKIAAQYNVYVCFGLIESRGNKLYNSAPIIGPTGVLSVYSKVHPFKPAEPWATPGSEYPLALTPWGPIGVGICYDDFCFPEVARIYAVKGARILLHPTAFPEFADATDYRDFWLTALGARAIDNHLFVAGANLVGIEGPLTFFGYSNILGPKPGQMNYHIYAGPLGTKEEMVMATLNLASLENLGIGTKTVFEDRRPSTYLALVSGVMPSGTAYTIIGICAAAALVFLGLWLWERKRKVS